jgi:hypothetical protein
MKYTLNAYGWSMEAVAKELTDEQVQIIKDKMEEEGYDELYQLRFELKIRCHYRQVQSDFRCKPNYLKH